MIATVAAVAVALVGMLPSEHVHAADDQQIVHRHVIADAGTHHHHHTHPDHGASVVPSTHAAARLLTAPFVTAAQFAMPAPVAVAAALVAPVITQKQFPPSHILPPTHDPPIRFVSSPAPPARS